jgi:hypothetical protein
MKPQQDFRVDHHAVRKRLHIETRISARTAAAYGERLGLPARAAFPDAGKVGMPHIP